MTLFAQQAESDDTSFELDVMTFNIRTADGQDGDNIWPMRKGLVVEAVRAFDPDVLGLQEALTVQLDFLQSEMPEYRWLGVDRGLNGGVRLSEATPIFYKYEVLVPIESGTFWLADDPNPPTQPGRGARIVTWLASTISRLADSFTSTTRISRYVVALVRSRPQNRSMRTSRNFLPGAG